MTDQHRENEQQWDDMYRSREQVHSGNANPVLVAEVTGLPPGRALDVGCGEGGDARWLARQGWLVTAVDVSSIALTRAAAASTEVADRIEWQHADLAESTPAPESFDLVSVQYFPLKRQPAALLEGLLDAVAPGGTYLLGSHDLSELRAHDDFRPSDYYRPTEIVSALDPHEWTVLIDDIRARESSKAAAGGGHHTRDVVLRAVRRG